MQQHQLPEPLTIPITSIPYRCSTGPSARFLRHAQRLERGVYFLVDGKRNLAKIANLLNRTDNDIRRILHGWQDAGYVETTPHDLSIEHIPTLVLPHIIERIWRRTRSIRQERAG